ncbi:uncharacterized protein QC761_0026300 [Podospora bellae-mahoneyi]|uniref:Uncharacterized protein n=1 Tax=Podospora bellae-mahoneyi TaxID=2093777 RepID=A0ABR0FUX1_9PEZI|nr:hypothetical protein QC761_0026300 [Podospora bellae-mahoneyi]
MSSITLDMHPVAWCSADLESGTRTIASCRRLVTRSGVVTHYLTAADARLRCLDMEILKGGTRAAWLQIASWFAGLRRSKRPLVFRKLGVR